MKYEVIKKFILLNVTLWFNRTDDLKLLCKEYKNLFGTDLKEDWEKQKNKVKELTGW